MATTHFTGKVDSVAGFSVNGTTVVSSTGAVTTASPLVVGTTSLSEAEVAVLDGVTAGTAAASKAVVLDSNSAIATVASATITKILTGATPRAVVDKPTITPAAGAANVCNVSIQFKDGAGTNIARQIPYTFYLSDSSTGAGVTATSASGTVTHTTGVDIAVLTAKKVIYGITNSSGLAVVAITDTVKTGFYCVASQPDDQITVSAQLVTGNYG